MIPSRSWCRRSKKITMWWLCRWGKLSSLNAACLTSSLLPVHSLRCLQSSSYHQNWPCSLNNTDIHLPVRSVHKPCSTLTALSCPASPNTAPYSPRSRPRTLTCCVLWGRARLARCVLVCVCVLLHADVFFLFMQCSPH